MSEQHDATNGEWDRNQLADAIEKTRRTSVYQGIGTHPVCLDDKQWKVVVEALRAFAVSETAPLVAGDLKTQREIHDSYAPSARVPNGHCSLYVAQGTQCVLAGHCIGNEPTIQVAAASAPSSIEATPSEAARANCIYPRCKEPVSAIEPLPMVLHCPACGLQHVDAKETHGLAEGEEPPEEPAWNNPPHRSHLCHGCGCIWRPADVPTNGVKAISTRGKADTWPLPEFEQNARADDGAEKV